MSSVSKRLQRNLWRGGLHLKYRLIHGPELVICHKHSIVVSTYVLSRSVYMVDEGVGHAVAVYWRLLYVVELQLLHLYTCGIYA